MDEKTVRAMVENMVGAVLDKLLRTKVNNIRTGYITKLSTADSRIVDVKVNGTQEVLSSVQVQKGATPAMNDFCLIISPDSSNKGQMKVIVY